MTTNVADGWVVKVEIFNLGERGETAIFVNGVPARNAKPVDGKRGRFMSELTKPSEQKDFVALAGEGYRVDDLRFTYFDISQEIKKAGLTAEEGYGDYEFCRRFKARPGPAMVGLNPDAFEVVAHNW